MPSYPLGLLVQCRYYCAVLRSVSNQKQRQNLHRGRRHNSSDRLPSNVGLSMAALGGYALRRFVDSGLTPINSISSCGSFFNNLSLKQFSVIDEYEPTCLVFFKKSTRVHSRFGSRSLSAVFQFRFGDARAGRRRRYLATAPTVQ